MKRILLSLVALCAISLGASAQNIEAGKVTLNMDKTTLRQSGDPQDFFYAGLPETGTFNLSTVGSSNELKYIGCAISIPGAKFKGMQVVGMILLTAQGDHKAITTMYTHTPEGELTQIHPGYEVNLKPLGDQTAVWTAVGFQDDGKQTIEEGKNYLFGFYSENITGQFLTQYEDYTADVNYFFFANDQGGLTVGPIEKALPDEQDMNKKNWIFGLFVHNKPTGVDGVLYSDGLQVFPENGKFVVTGEYNSLKVYDMMGQELNNENLTAGNYVVIVNANGVERNVKLSIK